ncbi:30S ribosomal protein S4 [endosymbiont GvMRE of Glomus versiforme]|uniref:30S ribosomal protein S4 n=1 Tax=endosymbiont GvMRE of Glomus versiforme TaxID=2039283 RepID=UPI000ECDCE67|nr:30S ribosomal protein S4 [endosymbiont GvMRE of Glomus versiforme]RHZ36696.1 30S ribosomal protein S4 [endosymbiont GvMRE of Glomus versiforme]
MEKRPIWKMSRALEFSLLGNKKEFSRGKRRVTPPGQHGQKKVRRKKISPFGVQNREKQRIRFSYGLKAKQLKNLFLKLKEKKGNTSQHVLTNLASRLDNLIFRSGLVSTYLWARKWAVQNHFLVNQKKINKPGYLAKPGDVISLEKYMWNNKLIQQQLQQNVKVPDFLKLDKEKLEITYSYYPSMEELEKEIEGINFSSVVEWYNQRT